MKTFAALTLALSLAGCATDTDVATTETLSSELGLAPTSGTSNHFYWAAYEQQPYIYKGCPEPGPEPWAERATLHARRGTAVLELELGTAVPLAIRLLSAPRGVRFEPNTRGATITVGDPFVGDPVGLSFLVNNERCSYELAAEIVYE